MMVCKILDGMAVDYGCRPSDLVRGRLVDLAFDIAVKGKARAE